MPDPLPCPECDAKIIVNGDVAARVLDVTCEAFERHLDKGGTFANLPKLVKMANDVEDLVFKFQREVLEQIGFSGPWPHSMS